MDRKFSHDLQDACEVKNKELSLLGKLARDNSSVIKQVEKVEQEFSQSQQKLSIFKKCAESLPKMIENYKTAYVNYLSGLKLKDDYYKDSSSPLSKVLEQSPTHAGHISSLSIRCLTDKKLNSQAHLKTTNSKLEALSEKTDLFFNTLDKFRAHSHAISAVMCYYIYSAFETVGKATYNLLRNKNIINQNHEKVK